MLMQRKYSSGATSDSREREGNQVLQKDGSNMAENMQLERTICCPAKVES